MGRPRKGDVEQLPLIDVEPENQKVILRCARAYLKSKDQWHDLNEEAKKRLNRLREAIKEANLHPLDGNVYRFRCGHHIIEMIPQSDKVKIKDAYGEAEGADDGGEDE